MSTPQRAILIVDTGAYTNRNRARRFIKKGKAIWTDESETAITFIEHYVETTSDLSWSALLDIRPIAKWEPCWRNTGAAVLPLSLEWLATRTSGIQPALRT